MQRKSIVTTDLPCAPPKPCDRFAERMDYSISRLRASVYQCADNNNKTNYNNKPKRTDFEAIEKTKTHYDAAARRRTKIIATELHHIGDVVVR